MPAAQVARVRAELNTHPAGRALERILLGLGRIELVDRSMTLAAQLFTSVLPVIMAASVLVDSAALRETLLDPFGVDPNSFVQDGFEVTSEAAAFGAVGLLMVLISGTSFARALGRVYGKIWATPVLRLSHAWRWCAVLLLVATSALATGLIHQLGSPILAVVAQLVHVGVRVDGMPGAAHIRSRPHPSPDRGGCSHRDTAHRGEYRRQGRATPCHRQFRSTFRDARDRLHHGRLSVRRRDCARGVAGDRPGGHLSQRSGLIGDNDSGYAEDWICR
ncbi:hypothetical protein ACFWCF_11955 [Rhodococcus sp. NPDC060090]|uniref:hypothetical protein n=1 Tax=Rhodococcus sp. NPDC060090 TaxID=3347056 RepID=UPI003652DECA